MRCNRSCLTCPLWFCCTLVICMVSAACVAGEPLQTPQELSLFKAAKEDDTKLTRKLLEQGADPNEQDAQGRTPLFYSVKGMDLIVLKTLLKYGANPNAHDKEGKTPVDAAQAEANAEAIADLVAGGAYVPAFALGFAVQTNSIKEATALLDAKVDPNAKGFNGLHPLPMACIMGSPEMVRLLVDHGADVNVPDANEMPSLVHATSTHNLSIVRFLLERGADAKFTDKNGKNVLMYVHGAGSLELVRLLEEHGASLKAELTDSKRSACMS